MWISTLFSRANPQELTPESYYRHRNKADIVRTMPPEQTENQTDKLKVAALGFVIGGCLVIASIFFLVLVVLLIIGFGSSEANKQPIVEPPRAERTFVSAKKGDLVRIEDGGGFNTGRFQPGKLCGFKSEEIYEDKFHGIATSWNLVESGAIVPIESGTEAQILEFGTLYKVKLLTSERKDQIWWVTQGSIKPISPNPSE